MLLNVSTATSAFFPPCHVLKLLEDAPDEINDDEIEKWQKGVTSRVVHRRTSGHSGDINDEKRRLEKFQNFGAKLTEQRFWKPDEVPTGPGITVWDYFTQGKFVSPNFSAYAY
jgi:hypothetical protein